MEKEDKKIKEQIDINEFIEEEEIEVDSEINDEEESEEEELSETKKKRKKKLFLVIGGIVVLLILLVAVSVDNSNFTVYPVQCNDWIDTSPTVVDFSNCKKPKALERQTFSVDASKNQVTQISPDNADVHQLNYCTIQDAQHWSCGGYGLSKGGSLLGLPDSPGGILASTQISRSGSNFSEKGLTNVIFVTESQWDSINNGKSSICGLNWCD